MDPEELEIPAKPRDRRFELTAYRKKNLKSHHVKPNSVAKNRRDRKIRQKSLNR